MLNADTPLGQLASEYPLATRTLSRHGIDFCCGGARTLATACSEQNLDPLAILAEVESDLATATSPELPWTQRAASDLIAHLLEAYHAPLKEELPRLNAMLDKVVAVHGSKAPQTFADLQQAFEALQNDLEPHMHKEEQILFPMILHGQGALVGGPISVMRHEHDTAGGLLKQIRSLTNDFVAPPEACNTWTALWARLAALETDLHQHIHLENNVLFPKVSG